MFLLTSCSHSILDTGRVGLLDYTHLLGNRNSIIMSIKIDTPHDMFLLGPPDFWLGSSRRSRSTIWPIILSDVEAVVGDNNSYGCP